MYRVGTQIVFVHFRGIKKIEVSCSFTKFCEISFSQIFYFRKNHPNIFISAKISHKFSRNNSFFANSKYVQAGSCIRSCITHVCAKTFNKTTIFANIFEKFYQILYNISYTEKRKNVCRLYNISYTEIRKAKLAEEQIGGLSRVGPNKMTA